MTQEDIQIVRQIIREELSNLTGIDRYTFQKNIQIFDGKNIQLGRDTGTKIGTETCAIGIGQKLGLFNATPILQFPYSDSGNTGTVGLFTAGSGNAVKDDSLFGGNNVGTTRYSIGDIITALKKLGILAQTA